MADVFISYAKAEKPAAQRLARALVENGYTVWWDDELLCHKSYPDLIREQIEQAGAVLVLWSAASVHSEWVRSEADAGRNMRKLVQASIDGRIPPMPFDQFQSASLAGWQGDPDHPGWRKVSRSLSDLLDRGAPPTPSAAPNRSRPPPQADYGSSWRVPLFMFLGALALALALALTIAGASAFFLGEPGGATQNQLQEPEPPRFGRAAALIDPHTSAAVHARGERGSPVIARINGAEAFTTYLQTGDWWEVRTAEGRTRFVERRLFRLDDERAPADDVAANMTETIPADANSSDSVGTNTTNAQVVPSWIQPAGPAARSASCLGAATSAINLYASNRLLERPDLRYETLERVRQARTYLAGRTSQAGGPTAIEAANLAFLDNAINELESRGESRFCW